MPYDGSQLNETTKLLIAARGMVERRWCRGIVPGGVCADFALSHSYHWHKDGDSLALDKARDHLQCAVGPVRVPTWNDDPETTQKDVLTAYDIAIVASLSWDINGGRR